MATPRPIERVFPIRLSILEAPANLIAKGSENHNINVVTPPADQSSEPLHSTDPEIDGALHPAVESPTSTVSGREKERSVRGANGQPAEERPVRHPAVAKGHSDLISERFEYALQQDGTHGVIQGTRKAFTRCEDEEIRIPGAIQSHGMLIALRRDADERFIPRVVSENSLSICRYTPANIFALDTFQAIMPVYQKHAFAFRIQEVYDAYDRTQKSQEPQIFSFSFSDPQGKLIPCWCAAHYLGNEIDLFICEFELQNYGMPPLAIQADMPASPVNTLNSDQYDAATVDSLQSRSQPVYFAHNDLDILLSGDDRSLEVIGVATSIQRQFSEATSVEALLNKIVGLIHELTRFHRCMVYQFDHQYNGTVVAELVDRRASVDFYRGLHFPASDIPKQARELYKINKVRVLFDRNQETARLVCRDKSDMATPLDLTHAYLRAMSPVHLKYLGNMGVRSSMSMSLEYEGELWGLICCHSYGPTATRVPFRIRELCYFLGMAASTSLEKLLNADKLQARKIIDSLKDYGDPDICITASSGELLKLFAADFGFLVVDGEARTIGKLVSYTEAVAVLKYLYFRRSESIISTDSIIKDFKDLNFEVGFKTIAGAMYIPLSIDVPDFVVFFRKDQVKEVHWAGKPSLGGKLQPLEPRNSFKKWTQFVHGTSKAWTAEQVNMAAMAQLVYGSFIRVWREKQAALNDTRLKRLLLHDASHQVRTPLNAVINYLELALEGPLDTSTKQILARSHSASKSLIYEIDDLLHLTSNSAGPLPKLEDPFDVKVAIEDTLEPLKKLAATKKLDLRFLEEPGTARYVHGEPSRLQRAISNLVANALEKTTRGEVVVSWSNLTRKPRECTMRVAVSDSGPGLSEPELGDLFAQLDEVLGEDADEFPNPFSPQTVRTDVLRLGVGLAYVARYVKSRNGQLKVTSLPGHGSTFALELPFITTDSSAHPLQAGDSISIAARRKTSPLPTLQMPTSPPPEPSVEEAMSHPTPESSLSPDPLNSSTSPPPGSGSSSLTPSIPTPSGDLLVVLLADDNKVNVQILQKRLSKLGHVVKISRDGQECYSMYVANQGSIDFILMDLNMPVVDGMQSARMIRQYEKEHPKFTRVVQAYGRTPIFAVSGGFHKTDLQKYIDADFDGWMPKPINMARLGIYLAGSLDEGMRKAGRYDPQRFDYGGWFDLN